MKKVILTKYKGRFWGVAKLELFKEGKLTDTVDINRYYEVTPEWFMIYEAQGGHDYIHQGKLIRKIFIGDAEYEEKEAEQLTA